MARSTSGSGLLQRAPGARWARLKFRSMRFGSYVGVDARARIRPLRGSSTTTAPQRFPSARSAVRCTVGSRVMWTSLPSIVVPRNSSSVLSSTVPRFVFDAVR